MTALCNFMEVFPMGANGTFELTVNEKNRFLARTYGWMALALLISAVSALFTINCIPLLRFLYASQFGTIILVLAELGLVLWLTSSIRTLSVGAATAGFVIYSMLNGITLSYIFLIYTIDSIASAFVGCSVMFGVMCVYGSRTSKNLMGWGRYLFMALVGIIIANLIQFVMSFFTAASFSMFNILVSIATVIVFTGLTAYDSQKIIRTAENAYGSDDYSKVAILGALELYLDFINLFLALLRISRRRR